VKRSTPPRLRARRSLSPKRLVILREIDVQPLQPGILVFELPQPPSLIDFETAILGVHR
jgi:hypothetical protein